MDMELKRERRRVKHYTSASFMSDTKWRVLFQAIADAQVEIRQIIVKFVGADDEKLIQGVSLHPPLPFVDTIEFGPIPLVSIEWLEFPKLAKLPRAQGQAVRFQQDSRAIRAAIEATGKHYELEERSARVTGYRSRHVAAQSVSPSPMCSL